MSFQFLSIWIVLRLSWLLYFLRLQASHFVRHYSIWVCPVFPYDGPRYVFLVGISQKWVCVLHIVPKVWHMVLTCPITGGTNFNHLVKMVSSGFSTVNFLLFTPLQLSILWTDTLRLWKTHFSSHFHLLVLKCIEISCLN